MLLTTRVCTYIDTNTHTMLMTHASLYRISSQCKQARKFDDDYRKSLQKLFPLWKTFQTLFAGVEWTVSKKAHNNLTTLSQYEELVNLNRTDKSNLEMRCSIWNPTPPVEDFHRGCVSFKFISLVNNLNLIPLWEWGITLEYPSASAGKVPPSNGVYTHYPNTNPNP